MQIRFCLFYEECRPVRIIGFIFTKSGVMAHPRTPHRGMRIFPAEIWFLFIRGGAVGARFKQFAARTATARLKPINARFMRDVVTLQSKVIASCPLQHHPELNEH